MFHDRNAPWANADIHSQWCDCLECEAHAAASAGERISAWLGWIVLAAAVLWFGGHVIFSLATQS